MMTADKTIAFTQITIEQKDRTEAIRRASGNIVYTYTFPTLFTWQEEEKYEICLTDGVYLIKNGARGENSYLFPVGTDEGKKRFVSALLESGAPIFWFVSDGDKAFLENAFPGAFVFEERRDDFSYIYGKAEQIAMSGKAFRDLRHNVNRGRAAYESWTFEPLRADNIERAREINRRWALLREDTDMADAGPAENALTHFDELSMFGLLFQADGEDIAYIAGSFVTPEIYDLNFCKLLDKRCDCYIKWLLYQELPEEVTTIDSEEDMGLPGLRAHKILRSPKEMMRMWKAAAMGS